MFVFVLQYFCHVSTAYCHLEQKVLEEKAYPALCNPHDVIKTVEWMDDDMLETMTPKLVPTYLYNMYTYLPTCRYIILYLDYIVTELRSRYVFSDPTNIHSALSDPQFPSYGSNVLVLSTMGLRAT